MSSTVYLTAEGLQKLKDDLHHARTVERQKISEEIAEARAQGDLSENAEYDAAKEAQGHLEARIDVRGRQMAAFTALRAALSLSRFESFEPSGLAMTGRCT